MMFQDAIAILLVACCVAYVAYQLLRTVRAGNGKAGSCCSKGCDAHVAPTVAARVQFIDAGALRRKR